MQTQLINFTIPKPLLMKVDFLAQKEARSRSELLREALRRYLENERQRTEDFRRIKLSASKINLSEEEALDLVDKIRKELPINQ